MRLRRVDCSASGIRRVRRGRGFAYLDENGEPIEDADVRDRIRGLAIPPAWTDVWICPDPHGHIQATGYDDAGRKQYRYHDAWREHRDRQKFTEMEDFAAALPAVRERVQGDLSLRGLVRERVLACAIRLLDLGFFRIGSERYAAENETYGLATLKKRQLRIERGAAVFDYRAKGSKRHVQVVADRAVLPTLKALKARRGGGTELFAYRNGRAWRDVRSDDINEHLKELAGDGFSAKDFRTWNATVLAAVALARHDPSELSRTARRRAINEAVKDVAAHLSNTPSVCRSAYIDPRVIDRFDSGETIRSALDRAIDGSDPGEFPDRERIEEAVLALIR
ncbi:MAG: DNA topoisomerase IB [Solirubrobacterales bacterium]